MATVIFNSSVAGTGVRANLGDDVDLYVSQNVTVGSEDQTPILSTGSNHRAIINGSVIGDQSGMRLGDIPAVIANNAILGSNQILKMSVDAEIFGFKNDGVEMFGNNSNVDNRGYIYGFENGIQMAGLRGDTQSTIVNSGTIESDGNAINRYINAFFATSETLLITNTGTIQGARSFYDNGTNAVERITNSGTMIGDVSLGLGDDLYDGRLGHVQGDINGGGGTDTIYGGSENNVIDGGSGADTMTGGAGNDRYVVDTAGDKVIEATGGGTDSVATSVSYTLAAGTEVESFTTTLATDTTAINLVGNEFAQTITGNAGTNTLDGKGGADKLYGLEGNDTYTVDTAGDQVFEAANAGSDRVNASLSYALGAGQSVETLALANAAGTQAFNLIGNETGQRVLGNAGANLIDGGGGIDILYGFGGADTFRFSTAFSSGNIDRIADFISGQDKIQLDRSIFTALDLGALTAGAYKDIGDPGAVVDANDRILYNDDTGALFYDSNGSAAGGRYQFATLDTIPATLTAADFFVVA